VCVCVCVCVCVGRDTTFVFVREEGEALNVFVRMVGETNNKCLSREITSKLSIGRRRYQ
jgi:hypothetical protein